MPILAWIAARITGEALKAGGEVAKTATEIPKNLIETQKAHLEVEELKFQNTQRQNLITPATFDEVKQYDPKAKLLHDHFDRPRLNAKYQQQEGESRPSLSPFVLILLWLCAGIAAYLILSFAR
jgi:hypothetical protein